MTPVRRRVLVVQPSLRSAGGGETVCAWAVQALAPDHDVTLLTLGAVDPAALDALLGTSLAALPFRHETAFPRLDAALARTVPLRLALLRYHLLLRRARALAGAHDVVLFTGQESPSLGVPGIQYVHFPWGYAPRPDVELRWFHRLPGVLPAYRALAARLSGFDRASMLRNLTLVNSDWTGAIFRRWYGGDPRTLHPPVPAPPPGRPWESREDAFLVLGRVAPEKRVATAIAIVERLRARHPELRLHVAGGGDAYARTVAALAAGRAWVTWHEAPTRQAVGDLLGRVRWGLHAMVEEHFGIAVAEMVRSGVVPFAHASGGPAEILEHEDLLWHDVDDAVARIGRVLDEPERAAALRSHLAARAGRWSSERFVRELRAVVAARASARS